MDISPQFAYLDEGGGLLPDGLKLYAMAAALSCADTDGALQEGLVSLLDAGQDHLHHYDMAPKQRVKVAIDLADLPLTGAIVVSRPTPHTHQEPTRGRLLSWVLPRLQHVEGVRSVIIESRSTNDKHDVRTRDRLRRSRTITSELRISHAPKRAVAQLWAADFLVGAFVAATIRGECEPWQILTDSHVIDVHEL